MIASPDRTGAAIAPSAAAVHPPWRGSVGLVLVAALSVAASAACGASASSNTIRGVDLGSKRPSPIHPPHHLPEVPLAGMHIELVARDGRLIAATITSRSGRFSFKESPGRYLVEVPNSTCHKPTAVSIPDAHQLRIYCQPFY